MITFAAVITLNESIEAILAADSAQVRIDV
jgi:hypothetical protein